eukprot:CAMPEP_0114435042 /NCGR_PEP_ID=MMETSP0103-20121206/12603_1 /TAXON_ID=37642 ORGANISM="Paraphysomonas imperforata, Strain PA2" /NCGR_SAMPLE_ID=MMETSP0103 /ASSEMBLY_ACC=CAM_ASM_000201 /LENGTH=455 /DNA_ID=CAMNT_0001605009 /DNA_START=87 /DNA_END=1454 /DNA_ORIENTATION=+
MLAAKKEDKAEGVKEDTDMFSNIFAGLSFPDAPTNTFVRKSTPSASEDLATSKNGNMIELQSSDTFTRHDPDAFAETEDFPIFPSVPSHTLTSDNNATSTPTLPSYTQSTEHSGQVMSGISISVPSTTQSTLSAQQMDSLYGHGDETVSSPKDSSGQSMYPSLNTLLASSSSSSESANTRTVSPDSTVRVTPSYSQNPAYVNYVEEEEEEGTEQTPLIQPQTQTQTQTQTQQPPPQYTAQQYVPQQPHVHTQSQQPLSQEELLKRENERLQAELRALQSSMSSSQNQLTQQDQLSAPVVISSSNAGIHRRSGAVASPYVPAPTQQSLLQAPPMNIQQIQQRQLQIQQQLQLQHSRSQSQTAPPQTQSQVGTSTANEQASLKYVCCGSCRQWLSSPRDAAFVYCPGCGAVNNCNIKPTDANNTSTAPPAAPTAPPARRVGDRQNWPWYLQCVEGLF